MTWFRRDWLSSRTGLHSAGQTYIKNGRFLVRKWLDRMYEPSGTQWERSGWPDREMGEGIKEYRESWLDMWGVANKEGIGDLRIGSGVRDRDSEVVGDPGMGRIVPVMIERGHSYIRLAVPNLLLILEARTRGSSTLIHSPKPRISLSSSKLRTTSIRIRSPSSSSLRTV